MLAGSRRCCCSAARCFPLFAVPDVIELGIDRTTIAIMAMEVAVFLAATLHAIRLRADEQRVLRYGAITAIEVLAVVTQLLVASMKPAELQTLNLTFCVLVLALFAFIPNRFVNSVYVCASGLGAMVVITTVFYPPEYHADLKSVMALSTMTVVGGWIGNTLHRSRREEYASLLHERWSNQRLVAEITRREALEEELTWLADHDTLTDLLNRRAFFELAEREFARSRRSNRPVSVLVIDADHFKSINDDYGHHTGDEAIKMIAGLCKVEPAVRRRDRSARRRGVRGRDAVGEPVARVGCGLTPAASASPWLASSTPKARSR